MPLGLCISRRLSFWDLPRELRDEIYRYSLVGSEPITVWSGISNYNDQVVKTHGEVTQIYEETVSNRTSTTSPDLTFNLLRASIQISREAAPLLYRLNTFYFANFNYFRMVNVWDPFYMFLEMIGEENRRHLRNIRMQIVKPKKVWQHPDGVRTTIDDWRFRKVIPQSAYVPEELTRTVNEKVEVDHLDPGIEACFRLLGKTQSKMTLVLELEQNLFPGVEMAYDGLHLSGYCFDLDGPMMVDRCRRHFTMNPDAANRVRVLWKGECEKKEFQDKIKLIKDRGWVIEESKEGPIQRRHGSSWSTILFTLSRERS